MSGVMAMAGIKLGSLLSDFPMLLSPIVNRDKNKK